MPYISLRRWTGSLATSLDDEQLVPGDFAEMENFIYDSNGFPIVRGGRRAWTASAISGTPTIRGLYYYRSGGVSGHAGEWVICYAGTALYESRITGTFTSITPTMTLPAGLRPSFTTFRGRMIVALGCSQYAKPYYWNIGYTEIKPIKAAPDAMLVATHASRLWVANRNEPSRIDYSAVLEPDNFNVADGAGWVYVGAGDGNDISAMVPGFAGEMIVFKDGPGGGATYRIQGLSATEGFTIYPLSTTVGAVSHRAVSMIADRDIYFASRRGIHSLRRVQEYGDLESASIDNEVSDKWRGLNDNSRAQAVAVDDFGNDTWWVFYDSNGDGKNDRGLLFNYRHQTSRGNPRVSEVDFGANAAVAFRSASTNREALLTGGIADGKVYSEHNPEANDDGVEFTWSATLAGIDGGESMTTKAWQDLTLMYDNWGLGTFDVEWYGDNHAPSSSTLSLDPHGAPIPMRGVRSGNVRGLPDPLAGMDMVHMMEGGRRIHIKLSGSRGRLRLRGMRLSYMPGRFDVTSDRHMPYTTTFPVSGA